MDVMDGYVRVSRKNGREGEGYITKKQQREAIERWASYHAVSIAAWHEDEDWSGGKASRPGLDLAIRRALNGQTGGIVAAKIDRFHRNTENGLRDLRRLQQAGARLAFVQEDIDTGKTMGKFFYRLMLSLAELFLDQSKESWADSRERAVERGAFIGMAPLGYGRVRDKNDPRVGGLVPDPAKKHIVQEAYRLAATSDNLHAATRYLREQLPGRWSAFQTRRLLVNRVYLGESRHGDKLVNPSAHEPLVSLGTWTAAQVDGVQRRLRGLDYPLSGVARCASCGGPLVGQIGHVRKDGTAPRRYRCGHKWNAGEQCDAPASCLAEPLENFVRDELRTMLGGLIANGTAGDDKLSELERELEEGRGDLIEFATDTEIKRVIGAEAYRAGCRARAERVDRLEAEYRKAAARSVHIELPLAEELDRPDQFERAVGAVIERVEVMRGRGQLDDRVRIIRHDAQ